jgi:hypothetical protein
LRSISIALQFGSKLADSKKDFGTGGGSRRRPQESQISRTSGLVADDGGLPQATAARRCATTGSTLQPAARRRVGYVGRFRLVALIGERLYVQRKSAMPENRNTQPRLPRNR